MSDEEMTGTGPIYGPTARAREAAREQVNIVAVCGRKFTSHELLAEHRPTCGVCAPLMQAGAFETSAFLDIKYKTNTYRFFGLGRWHVQMRGGQFLTINDTMIPREVLREAAKRCKPITRG